ncbi:MAG: hypothetical protein M1343_05535 [Chloroflexi bacterium]|nr:hypothetical protein [Chloroflexota bacterium]
MSKNDFFWEEIHAFGSLKEYKAFVKYLEGLVAGGSVEEIPADPNYGPGLLFGGRWFRHKRTGAIWRLLQAEFRFPGRWEPVRRD